MEEEEEEVMDQMDMVKMVDLEEELHIKQMKGYLFKFLLFMDNLLEIKVEKIYQLVDVVIYMVVVVEQVVQVKMLQFLHHIEAEMEDQVLNGLIIIIMVEVEVDLFILMVKLEMGELVEVVDEMVIYQLNNAPMVETLD